MKKLILLTSVFILFACSGSDDDNSENQVSINEDLVGAWIATIIDSDPGDTSTAEQTLTFNSNGTCTVSNVWDDGEIYNSSGTWSSTSTIITIQWEDDLPESADYELSNNNNTCVIVRNDGVSIIYSRL